MVSRGYTKSSWYLIDVEAGFELWQGGAGLATNSFSVSVAGATGSTPTPTPTPSGSASPTPTPTSPAGAACSAGYSVTSSWPGGFQGQVVVKNTGTTALSGWKLGLDVPG